MDSLRVPLQIEVTISNETLKTLLDFIAKKDGAAMTPKERSEHAHFGGKKPPSDLGLLIDTNATAKLLKVSSRTIFSMQTDGRMPKPIRIGSAVRWRYDEIKKWVEAGCPTQSEWSYESSRGSLGVTSFPH